MNKNKLDDKIDDLVYLALFSECENYIAFPSQVFRCLLGPVHTSNFTRAEPNHLVRRM